ncbi:MAG: hypothetical protein ACKOJI_11630, partial [Phycisphaerales bacterium]
MNEIVVDVLPTDLRRRGAALGARRRSMLLVSLLGLCVVGVCAHSWNSIRAAEQRRGVSLALAANSGKVDDLIERLAAEQRDLSTRIALSDRLALPAQAAPIAATHALPWMHASGDSSSRIGTARAVGAPQTLSMVAAACGSTAAGPVSTMARGHQFDAARWKWR